MLFNGGLIPTYLVVVKMGLIDSIWSLILPGALPVFSMVILMNFIRGLPEEIEESAIIDGAGPLQVLVRILLPFSNLLSQRLGCLVSLPIGIPGSTELSI